MNKPHLVQLRFVPTKSETEVLLEQLTVDVHGGSKWEPLGCMAILLFVSFLGLATRVGWHNIGYVIAGLAILVAVIVLVKRLRPQPGNVEVILELSDEGILFAGGGNQTRLNSSTVNKLIETDSMLIVRAGDLGLMLPKRAFECAADLDYSRELISSWALSGSTSQVEVPQLQAPRLQVDSQPTNLKSTVHFQLRLQDFAGKSLLSWLPRFCCAFILSLMSVAFCIAAANPPPDAVFTTLETVVYFMIPFSGIMCFAILTTLVVYQYYSVASTLIETRITLARTGIRVSDAKQDSVIDWKTRTRYKQSSRVICIWWPGTQGWLIIPKRAFDSVDHANSFVRELASYAQESTWFWR